MSQIGGWIRLDGFAPLFQLRTGFTRRKVLTREYENDVSALIAYRHSIGERVLSRHPTDVHTQRLVDPGAGHVKRFVTKLRDHRLKLAPRRSGRSARNDANYPRHALPKVRLQCAGERL